MGIIHNSFKQGEINHTRAKQQSTCLQIPTLSHSSSIPTSPGWGFLRWSLVGPFHNPIPAIFSLAQPLSRDTFKTCHIPFQCQRASSISYSITIYCTRLPSLRLSFLPTFLVKISQSRPSLIFSTGHKCNDKHEHERTDTHPKPTERLIHTGRSKPPYLLPRDKLHLMLTQTSLPLVLLLLRRGVPTIPHQELSIGHRQRRHTAMGGLALKSRPSQSQSKGTTALEVSAYCLNRQRDQQPCAHTRKLGERECEWVTRCVSQY